MDGTNDTSSLRDAWDHASIVREKATFATANLLICLLVPAWSAFDFYLEPALAPRFLVLRLVDVALTLAVWRVIARSEDLRRNRLVMSVSVVAVGVTIAAMLPQVGAHYTLYAFGFSLVFWGCGLLLIWPLPYAAATFGVILACHVALSVVLRDRVPSGDFVGSLFYLASAAIISAAQMVVRRRLEHEAFRASFALEGRNAQLASTLATLGTTQARLVAASAVLTESLDADATEAHVMSIAVPAFASWAVLVGTGANGEMIHAAEHASPELRAALREAAAELPRGGAVGAPECLVDAAAADVERVAGRAVARVVTARSLIVAPLVARAGRTGTLVLGRVDRNYEPNEIAFAEEIAQHAALALDNARLLREAEQAVRVRDDFISIASHELRTPLNTLTLVLAMIDRSKEVGPHAAAHVATAMRQIARLTSLVEQLLDVSRLTAGRLEVEREDMDLAELVGEVAGRFAADAAKAKCALDVAAPGPLRGSWDRARLDQVLSNLLSNAIKYGGGKPIKVTLESLAGRALLRVADAGIGIAASEQARIFQRFERAVSPRHYGGFGLGLWIARSFVEALGGTIRVESEPHHGATFIVDLPTSTATP